MRPILNSILPSRIWGHEQIAAKTQTNRRRAPQAILEMAKEVGASENAKDFDKAFELVVSGNTPAPKSTNKRA